VQGPRKRSPRPTSADVQDHAGRAKPEYPVQTVDEGRRVSTRQTRQRDGERGAPAEVATDEEDAMRPRQSRFGAGRGRDPLKAGDRCSKRPADATEQLLFLEGFRHVIRRAQLSSGNCGPHGLHGGHHDDRQVRLEGFELLQDLDPIDLGHQDIEEHEITRSARTMLSGPAVGGVQHRVLVVRGSGGGSRVRPRSSSTTSRRGDCAS